MLSPQQRMRLLNTYLEDNRFKPDFQNNTVDEIFNNTPPSDMLSISWMYNAYEEDRNVLTLQEKAQVLFREEYFTAKMRAQDEHAIKRSRWHLKIRRVLNDVLSPAEHKAVHNCSKQWREELNTLEIINYKANCYGGAS